MPLKKDQHYVPQMYLRNFSANRKSIGGYVLKEHKFVPNMPISNICQRDYLYGKDLDIEDWFQMLENKWGHLFKTIIRNKSLLLSDKELILLYEFILLSDARTRYAADVSNDELTKVCQAALLVKREKEQIPIDDDQINRTEMKWNVPIIWVLKNLKKLLMHFYGLDILLIINNTSRQFITSDNPVVKYNYFFATRNYKCSFGFDHIGALFILPITPELCLFVYDSETYEIKEKVDSTLYINAPDQIIELNKLIAQNSKSTIYFHNSAREWVIEEYAKNIKDTHEQFNNHILKTSAGSYFILSSTCSIFTKYKLDFLTIRPLLLSMPLSDNLHGPIRYAIKQLRQEKLIE